MVTPTSEQILSNLERSSDPAVKLLDSAFAVIGLEISTVPGEHITADPVLSRSDPARFREQWVLKWIIKKLAQEAAQVAKSNNVNAIGKDHLINNINTWTLLNHLLHVLPSEPLLEIILERQFVPIIGKSLEVLVQTRLLGDEPVQHTSSSQGGDEPGSPPTKKRRLSTDSYSVALNGLIVRVITVLDSTATVLESRSTTIQSNPITPIVRWADNAEAANHVLSTVLNFVNEVVRLKSQPLVSSIQTTDLFILNNRWLDLWSNVNFTVSKSSKKNEYILFNEIILTSALNLLGLKQNFTDITVFQGLERAIAKYTVLPAREAYYKALRGLKMADTNSLSETEINALVNSILQTFGDGLHSSKTSASIGFHLLLSIAGRIMPRMDVLKRRAERPWLEAFYYTLQQLTNSARSGVDDGPTDPAQKQSSLSNDASEQLLNTLAHLNIEPSSSFWELHVRHLLTTQAICTEQLATVIDLNVSLFLPAHGGNGALLESLADQIDALQNDTQGAVGTEILLPLLAAVGRARQLPAFINFWLGRLNKPICARGIQVWTDPRLLHTFETTCSIYTPISFCKKFLHEICTDLEGGYKNGTLASDMPSRVLIAIPMLKALNTSDMGRALIKETTHPISDVCCTVLASSDVLGSSRWIFWKLLNQIIKLNLVSDILKGLKVTKSSWPDEKSLHESACPEELTSFYYAFCSVITLYQTDDEYWQKQIEALAATVHIQMKKLSAVETNRNSVPPNERRLGSSPDIVSFQELTLACFAELTSIPPVWYSQSPNARQLLLEAMRVLSTHAVVADSPKDHFGKLVDAAEAVLVNASKANDVDMVDLYVEFATTQQQNVQQLPEIVCISTVRKLKKHQSQKMRDILLQYLNSGSLSEAGYLQCLNILSEVVSKRPAIVSDRWDLFVASLERATTGADAAQCVATSEAISRILSIFIRQGLLRGSEQRDKAVGDILAWAKTRIKTVAASKKKRLYESYDGFLVVAIISQLKIGVDGTDDSGLAKKIDKVQAYFSTVAPEIASKYIKKTPDSKACFLAWKTLECMQNPKETLGFEDEQKASIEKSLRKLNQQTSSDISPETLKLTLGSLKYLASTTMHGQAVDATHTFMRGLTDAGGVNPTEERDHVETKLSFDDSTMPDRLLRNLISSRDFDSTRPVDDNAARFYLSLASFITNLTPQQIPAWPDVIPGLQRLASLDEAVTETDAQALLFRLEISRMILERHPHVVNQHVVDCVLKSLILLSTPTSKVNIQTDLYNPQPRHIYERLCTVLSTLLIRYRRRINGRYHLLLLALQNLLKCLFGSPSHTIRNGTPATYASRASFLASLPIWLAPLSNGAVLTLPPSSAAKFSRLLQTLCDPSTSSARHALKRKRASHDPSSATQDSNLGLVDEAKLLRQQVSQHMQYLIETYCQATLDGYLAPDVKEKLTPGMYALVGATDIEILRTVNAGMSESQRAIWKDLYADWKRNGKWNQK